MIVGLGERGARATGDRLESITWGEANGNNNNNNNNNNGCSLSNGVVCNSRRRRDDDDDGGDDGDSLFSLCSFRARARRFVVGGCKMAAKRYPKEVSYH